MKKFLSTLKIKSNSKKNNIFNYSSNSKTNQTSQNHIDTDIIILGGGAVGLSLANSLVKSNSIENLIILDQSESIVNDDIFQYNTKKIPDMRAVSLTSSSLNFLKAIGAYDFLNKDLLTYVDNMQIWEKKGNSFVRINANEASSVYNLFNEMYEKYIKNEKDSEMKTMVKNKEEYISCLIELGHLQSALEKALVFNDNNSKVKRYYQKLTNENFEIDNSNKEYITITLKSEKNRDETHIRAKLLVISDGANSLARGKINYEIFGYDYHESGLVCTLKGDKSISTSFQRFLHDGIFALLPLYNGYYSIVCSMPKEINNRLLEMNDNEFIDYINHILHSSSAVDTSHFGRLIRNNLNSYIHPPIIESVHSKRMTFPFKLQYVNDPVQNNCVVIGDSSHTIHPLAGQGLNLGLADSALLSNSIYNSVSIGGRVNNKLMLDQFQKDSLLNTKGMITTMEIIKSMYQIDNYPFSLIRNFGMDIFNTSGFMKGFTSDIASGKFTIPHIFDWEKRV